MFYGKSYLSLPSFFDDDTILCFCTNEIFGVPASSDLTVSLYSVKRGENPFSTSRSSMTVLIFGLYLRAERTLFYLLFLTFSDPFMVFCFINGCSESLAVYSSRGVPSSIVVFALM